MCLGRAVLGLWTLYIAFIVMFFLSTLRAVLIRPNKEAPIEGVEDVLKRNKPIHILHDEYWEAAYHQSNIIAKCYDTVEPGIAGII